MNGQEKDYEIFEGSYTAEFWQYDSRLGRRWNTDPVVDASQSPYACFNNNPIFFSDPNGDTPGEPYKGGIKVYEAADAKGEVPGANSKAGEAFQVGDYSLLPNYVTNDKGEEVLSHYTASTPVKQIKPGGGTEEVQRIDYVLGKDDLKAFKDNVKVYAGAANLMYGGGTKLASWQIDMLNGDGGYGGYLKEQWTNPYNLIAAAHMLTSAWPTQNQVNLSGATYKPVAAQSAAVKNQGVLNYLQRRAPGDWLKVYEAAYLDGKPVEVHYFIHKQTGQYFDSKIKQQGWSDQFTKGKNKITGQ